MHRVFNFAANNLRVDSFIVCFRFLNLSWFFHMKHFVPMNSRFACCFPGNIVFPGANSDSFELFPLLFQPEGWNHAYQVSMEWYLRYHGLDVRISHSVGIVQVYYLN